MYVSFLLFCVLVILYVCVSSIWMYMCTTLNQGVFAFLYVYVYVYVYGFLILALLRFLRCVYVWLCVYLFVYLPLFFPLLYIVVGIYIYIYIYIYINIYVRVCMCECLSVYIFLFGGWEWVCVLVCLWVFMGLHPRLGNLFSECAGLLFNVILFFACMCLCSLLSCVGL